MIDCSNCGWALLGNEIRCPSCFMSLQASTGPSQSTKAPPDPTRQRRTNKTARTTSLNAWRAHKTSQSKSPGLLQTGLVGRVANVPIELPARPSKGLGLLGLVLVVVVLLPVLPYLLASLMPLLVLIALPFLLMAFVLKGNALHAAGCLASLFHMGRGNRQHALPPAKPGGVAFRMDVANRMQEVEFLGQAPRLAMGDEVLVSGFRLNNVLRCLHVANVTTGERRYSQLLTMLIAYVSAAFLLVLMIYRG